MLAFLAATALLSSGNALAQVAPAPAAPEPPTPEASAPSTVANVTFLRDYAEPTLWPSTIQIDGKKVVSLDQHSFTTLEIAPGPHKIQLKWSALSGQKGKEFEMEIEPSRQYVFEIKGISQSRIVSVGYGSITSRDLIDSGLDLLEPAAGSAKAQACCKFKSPKG